MLRTVFLRIEINFCRISKPFERDFQTPIRSLMTDSGSYVKLRTVDGMSSMDYINMQVKDVDVQVLLILDQVLWEHERSRQYFRVTRITGRLSRFEGRVESRCKG